MNALDFVLSQLAKSITFLRSTEVFGLSLFYWIAGLSTASFVLEIILGGDDDAD